MSTTLRKLWIPTLVLTVLFLLPGLALLVPSDNSTFSKGVMFIGLVLLNPAFSLVVAAFTGYRHGAQWLLLTLVALAFIPAMLLIYNSSALIYAAAYAIFAALGLGLGWALRTWARRVPAHR